MTDKSENISYLTSINEEAESLFNRWLELLVEQNSEKYKKALYDYYHEEVSGLDPSEDVYILFNQCNFVQDLKTTLSIMELTIQELENYSEAQKIQFDSEEQTVVFLGDKVNVRDLRQHLKNKRWP